MARPSKPAAVKRALGLRERGAVGKAVPNMLSRSFPASEPPADIKGAARSFYLEVVGQQEQLAKEDGFAWITSVDTQPLILAARRRGDYEDALIERRANAKVVQAANFAGYLDGGMSVKAAKSLAQEISEPQVMWDVEKRKWIDNPWALSAERAEERFFRALTMLRMTPASRMRDAALAAGSRNKSQVKKEIRSLLS